MAIENISGEMGDIQKNTHSILNTYQQLTPNMDSSIRIVGDSSSKLQVINARMKEFEAGIQKVVEIAATVKKISLESNILALNASIEAGRAGEAGKGFVVVATSMRELAVNTTRSAESIANHIERMSALSQELAKSMDETANELAEGNRNAIDSLRDLKKMSSKIADINKKVDTIFEEIDNQTSATIAFADQIDKISESYNLLSEDCINLGKHIFKAGRYEDKTRSDLVRGNSDISVVDWLQVFKVDHFIFTWRVYNNIVGFEQLKQAQVDSPESCKLGKWIARQDDPQIVNSAELQRLKIAHNHLHMLATSSWMAKDKADDSAALEYFNQTLEAHKEFEEAINQMMVLMGKIGTGEETRYAKFE